MTAGANVATSRTSAVISTINAMSRLRRRIQSLLAKVEQTITATADDERGDRADCDRHAGSSDEPLRASGEDAGDDRGGDGVQQEARPDLVDRPVALEVQLEVYEPTDQQGDRRGDSQRSSDVHAPVVRRRRPEWMADQLGV